MIILYRPDLLIPEIHTQMFTHKHTYHWNLSISKMCLYRFRPGCVTEQQPKHKYVECLIRGLSV